MREMQTSVLVVGGGTGGVAAALAAASRGQRVILTEMYPWLGGQLTSQIVPPDENGWIETCGVNPSYRRYREGVRQYYRDHYPLKASARANARLNPGGGRVSRLCHEPRVGAAVIDQMLAPYCTTGRLQVLQPYRPVAAETQGDRITAVTLEHVQTREQIQIAADYILDATELGDLLKLSGTEYVSGAESRSETGELHAVEDAIVIRENPLELGARPVRIGQVECCLVEVELHHLGGNGAQLANIQLRSEQSARKSVGDVERGTHVGLTSDLMSRVSRCAGVNDLRSGIISANSLNVALISHTSSPCLARL